MPTNKTLLNCAGAFYMLLLSQPGFASGPAQPSLTHPNVTQVSPRVYALIGDMDAPNAKNQGFICNSVFVITDKGVVVVDPGGSVQVGRMIIAQIQKRTNKPITHVINTHHHADHWMGNQAFAELTPRPRIIGHVAMRESAAQIGEQWITLIDNLTKGANKGTKVVLPTDIANGDETYEIGNLHFQLYHPPHAHTQGDLTVYIPEEHTLIAGDILFHQRTPGFQDASPLGNASALEQLRQLDILHAIPGHGPVTDKDGMDSMIDYIKLLHREVKKYQAMGLSDFEMKDKIDVGKYREMSGFDERFGINVNRMFLEVEAASF